MYQLIVLGVCVVALIAFILFWNKKQENFTNEKHRIVLYFSPSCGHCKAFMGTWNEFADKVNSSDGSRVIASKVNCMENECPNIQGFPTVILHKNNGEIRFNEQRTVKALENFIDTNY